MTMPLDRDVSPVTFPAYPATEAALRSLSAATQLPPGYLRHAADQGHLRDTVLPCLDPRRLLPRGAPRGRHAASFVR
ncbi:MAG: hypothetical protein ACXV3F_00440 [Frankiaceae bacterium]